MRPHLPSVTALIVTAALGACSADATGPSAASARSVSVSFSATGGVASAVLLPGLQASAASIASSADALVITKVQLVLSRLELQRVGATCPVSDDDDGRRDDSSCAELELAPTLVDLPVDSSSATSLKVPVPAGTYSALEAKIRPVDAKRRGAGAFLAAHPELAGASVRVEGTFNGKAFTFTGAPRAELESVFNPPLVADSSGANITVKVDLTNWFRTPSGTLIDPATALAGGPNAGLVSSNIARSFRAFRDDDHDGRDDHGDRSGRD
jgi:hypothetical protein